MIVGGILIAVAVVIVVIGTNVKSALSRADEKELRDIEQDILHIDSDSELFNAAEEEEKKKKPTSKLKLPPGLLVKTKSSFARNQPSARPVQQRRRSSGASGSAKILTLYDNNDEQKGTFLSKRYAPFGSLVQCSLVNTVDSGNIETPIIATVTKNLCWTNRNDEEVLIIPVGTVVFGTARPGAMRNRIAGGNSWTFVFQKNSDMCGYELVVSGLILEKSKDPEKQLFTITDMTAGIPGEVMENDSAMKKIAAMVAAFGAGVAEGYAQQQAIITDNAVVTTSPGDAQSSIALGAQNVFEVALQDISRQLAKDSFFVRAPSGQEFYLMVTQVINLDEARVADTLLRKQEEKVETRNEIITRILSRKNSKSAKLLNKFNK